MEEIVASVQCPLLTDTNYTVWTMRMKAVLKVHEVWEAIDPGENDVGEKDDLVARALLFQSIPDSLILQVGNLETAKAVWEAIKTRADRVREVRLRTLTADFDRLKMKETDSIDSFAGRLSELSSRSTSLGENVEEPKLVKKFLNGLPRKKYIHIVAALEQVLDLNKTSFENIVERMKVYEERMCGHGEENKRMYTNADSQPNQERYESGRGGGRGRGGRYGYRGRGRGPI